MVKDNKAAALVPGTMSDMDLRLLRVFRSVAEAGGISAAELELNIGRSTISRHIKDLEIRLGMTLCRRGRSGFALTDEGQVVYSSAIRLFGAIDQFRSEVGEVHDSITGNLVLAFFDKTASNPQAHIGQALHLFEQRAPRVSIDIHVKPLNEIETSVMEGSIHLGIIPAHRHSPSLDYLPLFDEQMYLYCGVNHPLFDCDDEQISHQQLQGCKYAGLGYHSPNMEVSRTQALKRAATVYDQEAILHLLLSGSYLGYLPDHYAQPFVDSGKIRTLKQQEFQYLCTFLAITRHAPKPSRVVATFLDCLQKAHKNFQPHAVIAN